MMNPFKSKKGLGRGLSSLIGDSDIKDSRYNISISSIVRNKYQPRKNFEKENLEELTNSIKERGIIQPIIVRKSDDHDDKFEIIAGERRWLAAQNAGLHEVPIVIIKADNLKSLEFAIVENVQRKDLNPRLTIRGILLTMYDRRNKLSGEVEREARNYFKEKVYQTVVPRNVRLSEAPSYGVPVLVYDKTCLGSKSYFNFTDEFLNQDKSVESAAWWILSNQKKAWEEVCHL